MNQKKVLALVLAFACAFTMFAGAAFTDEADFAVDTDVVDTLVALGVINGYTDGSFQPDATVTRAEMAKMIYVIRTGRSDASAYNNDATTFTDITDHWARGYIKYCQSLGVIAGKSATVFDPDATVTTQEAAKMLLVTLGYNAEKAGLVGTGWGAKTTALADENGLLEDVNCGTTQGMPRQYAAQLIYNAIFTPTVVLRDGEYTNMNLIGDAKNATIGEKFMSLKSVSAKLTGYNDKVAQFEFADQADAVSFEDYTADDSDLIGKTVKILYKESTNGKATIYGLYLDEDNTYIDTIVGQITDRSKTDSIKVNGTKYDIATNAEDVVKTWNNTNSAQPATVVLDKNGDVYNITLDTFAVGEVTFVGSKSINTTAKNFTDLDKVEAYDGIAKDDWVVITKNDYTGNDVLTKADVVSGKVDVENGDDYTIDGTVYTLAKDVSNADLDLGNTVEVTVVNGYIYHAEKVSGIASMDEIVYIDGIDVTESYGESTAKAKAIFADGTTAEIKLDSVETNEKTYADAVAIEGALTGEKKNDALNGLYAFDLDDDKYELTTVDKYVGTDKDYETSSDAASAGDDKIAGMRVNDDAVVFVVDGDGDVSVKTGKEVAAWNATDDGVDGVLSSVVAYANKTNGVNYVELAAIVLKDDASIPGASDTIYGYVVKTLGQTKEDNTTYNSYEVWTSTGLQTIKVKKDNDYSNKTKNDFVAYENDKLTSIAKDFSAVTGIAGDSVYFDGNNTEYVITDDTQIVYISVADVEGAEGGSIILATDVDGVKGEDGKYADEKNVLFHATKNGSDWELDYVFVDVNNDIADMLNK